MASLRSRNTHLEKGLERERAAREKGEKEVSQWGRAHMGGWGREERVDRGESVGARVGARQRGGRVWAGVCMHWRSWDPRWGEGCVQGYFLGPEAGSHLSPLWV